MEFELTDKILRRICEVNNLEVRKKEMVFFGMRGSLPENVEDYEFGTKHKIVLVDVNYINPRCTLGQWLPKKKSLQSFRKYRSSPRLCEQVCHKRRRRCKSINDRILFRLPKGSSQSRKSDRT